MKQEIIEGNKLIAEFMGGKKRLITNKAYLQGEPPFTVYDIPNRGSVVENFQYHTSWDWLMPVVEKIGLLSYNDSNNKFQPTVERFLENDIDSVWRQVVIFLTWYNHKSI